MDDKDIIDLYLQRDELAINETQTKYGSYCYTIANNILSIHEYAEECVNDTWYYWFIALQQYNKKSKTAIFFEKNIGKIEIYVPSLAVASATWYNVHISCREIR